jgi:hypothetical protein
MLVQHPSAREEEVPDASVLESEALLAGVLQD